MQEMQYMHSEEAAAYLGIQRDTLYKKCQKRLIPFYAMGTRNYLFKKSELESYIEQHRVATNAETMARAGTVLEAMDHRSRRRR